MWSKNIMSIKYHISIAGFAAVFFCAAEGSALPPVVESIGFIEEMAAGTDTVDIVGRASCDGGTTVTGMQFSVTGVSAAQLMAVYEGKELPSTVAAVEPIITAHPAIIFMSASSLPGQASENPGEYTVSSAVPGGGLVTDALFVVGAVATDGNEQSSLEKKSLLILNQDSPAVGSVRLSIGTVGTDTVMIFRAEVPGESDLAGVDFSLKGASAKSIIQADGVLENAVQFISDSVFVAATPTPGQTVFTGTLTVPSGVTIPADGVMAVQAEPLDWSGNRSAFSQLFYVADVTGRLDITGITVTPSSVSLTEFADNASLTVLGILDGIPSIDISAASSGVTYGSSDSMVASVSENGLVTALTNGTAEITVRYGEFTATVPVTVSGADTLQGITFWPVEDEEVTIPQIGATAQLTVRGQFSGGGTYDISGARFGTQYLCSNSYLAEVSKDGLVKGLGEGTVTITAGNGGYSDSIDVIISNGPPTIRLTTPTTVVHEKDTFTVTAEVEDDLGLYGIDYVQFFLDGYPLITDEYYPFTLSLQAPEDGAGTIMTISAKAVDTHGYEVMSDDLPIRVIRERDTIAPAIELLSPSAGSRVVAGVALSIRVTTGPDGELLNKVEFIVDGGLAGSSSIPYYMRRGTGEYAYGQEIIEILPVWQTSYLIPERYADQAMAITARAYDRYGNISTVDPVIIRVVDDEGPTITVQNPQINSAVIAGRNLPVSISVYDDLNACGQSLKVYIARNGENLDEHLVYSGSAAPAITTMSGSQSELQTAGSSSFNFNSGGGEDTSRGRPDRACPVLTPCNNDRQKDNNHSVTIVAVKFDGSEIGGTSGSAGSYQTSTIFY